MRYVALCHILLLSAQLCCCGGVANVSSIDFRAPRAGQTFLITISGSGLNPAQDDAYLCLKDKGCTDEHSVNMLLMGNTLGPNVIQGEGVLPSAEVHNLCYRFSNTSEWQRLHQDVQAREMDPNCGQANKETNKTECLNRKGCGWCGDMGNGVCLPGDLFGPLEMEDACSKYEGCQGSLCAITRTALLIGILALGLATCILGYWKFRLLLPVASFAAPSAVTYVATSQALSQYPGVLFLTLALLCGCMNSILAHKVARVGLIFLAVGSGLLMSSLCLALHTTRTLSWGAKLYVTLGALAPVIPVLKFNKRGAMICSSCAGAIVVIACIDYLCSARELHILLTRNNLHSRHHDTILGPGPVLYCELIGAIALSGVGFLIQHRIVGDRIFHKETRPLQFRHVDDLECEMAMDLAPLTSIDYVDDDDESDNDFLHPPKSRSVMPLAKPTSQESSASCSAKSIYKKPRDPEGQVEEEVPSKAKKRVTWWDEASNGTSNANGKNSVDKKGGKGKLNKKKHDQQKMKQINEDDPYGL